METIGGPTKKLPVFFFHGIALNSSYAANYVSNLTAEGHVVVPLTFCENTCALQSLKTQVALAMEQLSEVVTGNSTFDGGYNFIGHSLGALISRSVIELWDDHKVRKYTSLAGIQNGIFYNPQEIEVEQSLPWFNSVVFPNSTGFDFNAYAPEDYTGKIQYDLMKFHLLNPRRQYEWAWSNVMRSPHFESWAAANPHLPLVNNVNPCAVNDTICEDAKAQRKTNFLKLEEAHFFGSPDDGLVTPWELEILGQTSEVDTLEEIITEFANLTVLDVTETREYVNDTYGLKTLDDRGVLITHNVTDVPHMCWLMDTEGCTFAGVYAAHVYPVISSGMTAGSRSSPGIVD